MRNVFYYGKKPNVHPKEQYALNLDDARNKSKSEHFWIINEFCDYTDFDWDFDFDLLPDEDVWAEKHNNVWPSQHQKDSGTWLCSKNKSEIIVYRNDVEPITRKPDIDKFKVFHPIKNFDFSWHHDPTEPPFIYAWGNTLTSAEESPTIEYHVPGATQYKYMSFPIVEIDTNLSMFFIDKGNIHSESRFEKLKEIYPQLQKTRYVSNWVTTISRCVRKTETKLFWIISSEYDYSEFKFDFYPNTWQMNMVHVFGTQWNNWGNTYLINAETFLNDTKYISVIEHLSNINLVKNRKAVATDCLYDIYFVDYGNTESDTIFQQLKLVSNTYEVRYQDNLIQTFKNILEKANQNNSKYIWICSSICDYSNFNFSYIIDPFAADQLHVFPSEKQKFGDTFFVSLEVLEKICNNCKSLFDFDKINFNNTFTVSRLTIPKFVVEYDSHIESIQKIDFDFPYAQFTVNNCDDNIEHISLWSEESKNIVITGTGATSIICPKEVKNYVKSELYDYPYIIRSNSLTKAEPLDIIFLSNGEDNADLHYEHLLNVTKHLPNRVKRVDGIDGRVKSFHAAAMASQTPWAFIVFAKLKVDENFDFSWQPDRLRKPKHYIFYAKNPLNGLIYGHQSMCAYNKKIVLETTGKELDFTMEGEHDVVDMYSGVAEFNTSPYTTWRTAFREAIKLKYSNTEESKFRLNIWLTVAEGDFAEYCLLGAKDGVDYYNEVNGNFDKLKLSYEWDWLNEYYSSKYKND